MPYMSIALNSTTLSISECKNALKRHNLNYKHLDKDSPIREMRNLTINLRNRLGEHLYFIKKSGFHYDSTICLGSEIWFYKFMDKNREFDEIKRFVPQMLGYEQQLLILENLYQFNPIYEFFYLPYKVSNFVTNQLAIDLAILHGRTHRLDYGNKYKNIPVSKPYIPCFDRITPEILAHNNDSFIEILEIIQDGKLITSSLDKLRKLKRYCLVHGDLKFDNILISNDREKPHLRIIDWELCGMGNPAMDVGTVIGNYLLLWIGNMQLKTNNLINSINNPKISFFQVTSIINYFLDSYKKEVLTHSKSFPLSITNTIICAGLFLLLSVYSDTRLYNRLSPKGLMTLLLSKTLISQPNYAISLLKIE